MQVLILDNEAAYYKKVLGPKFPALSIHAATRGEDVGDIIEKAEVLMVKRISDDLIKKAANLKWIQCLITGVDFIVTLPSYPKDVLLTSTRGIHGPQMTELALLLMLALNRKFPQVVRNQDRRVWDSWPVSLLWKKKVGILGVGVIGLELAQKCKAMGMTVYGITRNKRKIDSVDHSFGPDELLKVMQEVDFFVNIVPRTPETVNMIGAKEFAAMKPTAFFINIGRGETVDEAALVDALQNGEIAGAGVDIYCTEPLPEDHPLWGLKNMIVSPHQGGKSDIYADQALPILEENIKRYLQGERRNLINVIDL
jgi:phosphoglycerate dehydrogenase-like enzyme